MYDKSRIKIKIVQNLAKWNYELEKASPYLIARKIDCSEAAVTKILRYLKDQRLVDNRNGSWRLI